MAVEIESAE